jgi:hypothetical protein
LDELGSRSISYTEAAEEATAEKLARDSSRGCWTRPPPFADWAEGGRQGSHALCHHGFFRRRVVLEKFPLQNEETSSILPPRRRSGHRHDCYGPIASPSPIAPPETPFDCRRHPLSPCGSFSNLPPDRPGAFRSFGSCRKGAAALAPSPRLQPHELTCPGSGETLELKSCQNTIRRHVTTHRENRKPAAAVSAAALANHMGGCVEEATVRAGPSAGRDDATADAHGAGCPSGFTILLDANSRDGSGRTAGAARRRSPTNLPLVFQARQLSGELARNLAGWLAGPSGSGTAVAHGTAAEGFPGIWLGGHWRLRRLDDRRLPHLLPDRAGRRHRKNR